MLTRCLAAILMIAASASVAPAESRRVVSLSPNLTELVFALGFGSNLVGRSSACDYPPGVGDIPVVGGFGRTNWEVLESLRPDLVLATDLEKPGMLGRLQEKGIQTLLLPCESWNQLMQAGLAISKAFNRRDVGEEFIRAMSARRQAL